jgi:endonuclease/exonuclease/phosphatase family metal-dependent hydrolase
MHARNTASIVEMGADVILLQEVSEGLRTSGGKVLDYRVQTYLYPQLIDAGYTLVDVEVGDFPKGTLATNFAGINYTPIWYDSNTVTLEACGHKFFDSVRTNPDGALSSSKSNTWALFTQKSTGKQFVALSTHYTWHSSAEMGKILRNNDAKEVMAMVAQIEEQYNVPVVVMGDLNSNLSTPAYETMASGNLANGRELADMVVNAAYSSSHTYGASATYMPTFGNPIDHAFASKEGWIMTKHQNHVTDKAIAATDHVPLSMDFILT